MTRADLDRVRRLGATPETRRAAAEALHALDALEIRLALDAGCARRVHREGLLNYLGDNQNAWELRADGSYHKIVPADGEAAFSAQLSLLEDLYA